jgi:hypothetical protein
MKTKVIAIEESIARCHQTLRLIDKTIMEASIFIIKTREGKKKQKMRIKL